MVGSVIGFLRYLVGIDDGGTELDGFGQSIADDIRFAHRFRACRKTATVWRAPTPDEAAALDHDPVIGRFGNLTIGLADVAGRRWIVRERDWHGWPDPPRFVFFAVEERKIRVAVDFDHWPMQWQWPPVWAIQPNDGRGNE